MKLITQPRDSVICGQCSLAMVLDEPLESVYTYIGKPEDGTTYDQYIHMFNRRGIKYNHVEWSDNRKKALMDISGKGVISITDRAAKIGHAMAFENGVIYDPAGRVFEGGVAEMKKHYKRYWKGLKVFSILTVLP